MNQVTNHLGSADISIYSKGTNFGYVKKYRHKLHFKFF